MMGAGMEVEFPKVLSSSKFFRNFYLSLGLLYIKKNCLIPYDKYDLAQNKFRSW